jgi:hypothetical protein
VWSVGWSVMVGMVAGQDAPVKRNDNGPEPKPEAAPAVWLVLGGDGLPGHGVNQRLAVERVPLHRVGF